MVSKQKGAVSGDQANQADLRSSCVSFVLSYLGSSRREAILEHIPMRHSLTLCALLRSGPKPVTEMAARMSVSPATVSAVLDELFESGLLHREHSSTDRRLVLVSLTPRGRRIAERIEARMIARWDELEKDIATRDVAATIRVLRKITSDLEHQNAVKASTKRRTVNISKRGRREL